MQRRRRPRAPDDRDAAPMPIARRATGCERRHHSADDARRAEREVERPQPRRCASSAVDAEHERRRAPSASSEHARRRRPSRAPSAAPSAPPSSSAGSSMRCQRQLGSSASARRVRRRSRADPLPKSMPYVDRRPMAAAAGAAPIMLAAMIEVDGPHQALRRPHRRRRRLVPLRARHRHRLPRAQRRRQDDDAADARAGSPPPTRGTRDRARRPATASCPTRAARRRPARRLRAARRAAAGARRWRLGRATARRAATRRVDELLERVGLDRAAGAQARAAVLARHAPAAGHRARAARRPARC